MNLLLVDISNVTHRAAAVNDTLVFGDKFTGGLYGVINMLAKVLDDQQIDRVVFCLDMPPYKRTASFSGYKGDRNKERNEEVIQRQRNVAETKGYLRDLASLLQIPWIGWDGYEADDVIAWITEQQSSIAGQIYVMSNDSDLYQLLRYHNVSIVKKSGLYNHEDFDKQYGISPRDWTVVSAMAGTHNALPGISRIGEKTAIKILKDSLKFEKTLTTYAEIIERNEPLIKLPHPQLRHDRPDAVAFTYCQFHERRFIKFLDKYGISISQRMRTAFDRMSAY